MQFDREKLKAVVLYTCSKCEPSQLGAVKLHKVLYFTDMLHFAHVGTPVTGATYRKRTFGPTCDALLPALRELESEGAIKIEEVNYFGFQKKQYVPKWEADLARLNDSERSLLDAMIDFVCLNNTATTISDFSHQRPWEMAEFGAEIKYISAFHMFPTEVSAESLEWGAAEAEKIEAARSQDQSVDHRPFGALRVRVLEVLGQGQ